MEKKRLLWHTQQCGVLQLSPSLSSCILQQVSCPGWQLQLIKGPMSVDGQKIRNPRTPSTMQTCAFFSNPFLEFCFLTPAFPSTILLHKFLQVFDTLKIPVYCFGTQDPLKKVLCLIVSQALFVLLSHFHMNLKILDMQNVWPNWLSTCCWQFSTGNHQYVMFCRRKILMMQRCTAKIMQRASSGSRKSL